jgi:hypothetical protein
MTGDRIVRCIPNGTSDAREIYKQGLGESTGLIEGYLDCGSLLQISEMARFYHYPNDLYKKMGTCLLN